MPKVSILVPAYNSEKFLPECLASIEAQTFRDFECILIDDGSTDTTGAMLDAFAVLHPYARVIHQENKGLAETRRISMQNIRGEFFICLDSDDYWAPELLETVIAAQERTGADIVAFRHNSVYENGELKHNDPSSMKELFYDSPEKVYASMYTKRITLFMWDKLYRSTLAQDIPNPLVSRFEDAFYNQQLLANAGSMVSLPDRLHYYRQNSQSVMHTLDLKKLEEWLVVSDYIRKFAKARFPALSSKADAYLSMIRLRCFDMIFMEKPFYRSDAWRPFYRRLWSWLPGIMRADGSIMHRMRKLYALTILFCPPVAAAFARKKLSAWFSAQ